MLDPSVVILVVMDVKAVFIASRPVRVRVRVGVGVRVRVRVGVGY